MAVILPEGYIPSEQEEYMNPFMLEYFKQRLIEWREELLAQGVVTMSNLKESERQIDDLDKAQQEYNQTLELRARDRTLKLIKKIEEALQRIDEETYGYCMETNEHIGVKRLLARPVAQYTVEAQEQIERIQKVGRDNHWSYIQ